MWRQLQNALHRDNLLLGGIEERTILDAVTIRPADALYDGYMWPGNHIQQMSDEEVRLRVKNETAKLHEMAGIFRGVAVELRARGDT